MTRKKVLLITEFFNPPFDEGIKKTAFNLFESLNDRFSTKVICRHGIKSKNVYVIKSNKLFLSRKVYSLMKEFQADVIIYLPFQSSTFASYLRLFILRCFNNFSKSILIALQPKPLNMIQVIFLLFLSPKLAFTPSPELSKFWNFLNIPNFLIPLQTNLEVFKPVTTKEKNKLRDKYGIERNKIVVSHLGHLTDGRNLESLIPIQKDFFQVVVVSSTSTPKDANRNINLKKRLEKKGIQVFTRFFDKVEEIYQLSDIYVFPVEKNNSSIGMPLSILEARACGIPVVTTNYGSVKNFLENDYGGIIYSNPTDFLVNCTLFAKSNKSYVKSDVEKLNSHFFDILFKKI